MTATHAHMHPGRPSPLGASWDGAGTNFALFSAHAERVSLCVFDARGRKEVARYDLPEYTDQVWHGYLPDVRPGTLYGYRVYGPYEPMLGHRFNHHKLLLDPYAKRLVGKFKWTDAHYGFIQGSPREDLSFDRRDNAGSLPKCAVVEDAFSWSGDRRMRVPFSETVIYELHVRGFTRLNKELPRELRGTYGGLAHPKTVAYLKALGVTSVELMPVHAMVDDRFLVKEGRTNYWGYNTLGFFACENRYMGPGGFYDFKSMVKSLHEAGLEVILDVVYNHTAEGSQIGPTLSWRGIDNRAYYLLDPANPRYYLNYTGCGNTLNLTHPRVVQMVMDSLRYWALNMHVDGFRFDLATVLGREAHGFDSGAGFFDALGQDPVLSRLKLIAEPWDVGPDGYQLGKFPGGWAEWNDQMRDTNRRFWNSDSPVKPELARRLHGSGDRFEGWGRKPWASINFAACHDGFTLADLVSYSTRHNLANGEDNRDGHAHEICRNWGVEGPTDDPEIQAIRRRGVRNMLATVFVAQGTPMLQMGDECGRGQEGNNNAYCQDNALAWMPWGGGRPEPELTGFVQRLTALRRAHPVLRRTDFLHGTRRSAVTGYKDLAWYGPAGREMAAADWHDADRAYGMLLAGDVAPREGAPVPADTTLFVALNGNDCDVPFHLPTCPVSADWRCLLDTYEAEASAPSATVSAGASFCAKARSLYVFALELQGAPVSSGVAS